MSTIDTIHLASPIPAMSTPALLAIAQSLEACAQALRVLETPAPVVPAPVGPTVPSLLTVTQLCRKHPAFRPATVYVWLAAREANGLAAAVIHVTGVGRILIDEHAFFVWLERYREQPRVEPVAPVLRFPQRQRRV